MEVVFTNKAYVMIFEDSRKYKTVETGGILLGYKKEKYWHVVETVLPGKAAFRKSNCFSYDSEYLEMKANEIALLYDEPLQLLGVWHKHPIADFIFSREDQIMHNRYMDVCESDILSGIISPVHQDILLLRLFRISKTEIQECDWLVK